MLFSRMIWSHSMTDEPPNVLVVMSDDHAQWASGAYGHEGVSTPAIDHLARTGVRFENAVCPTPVCSPARASFFTGLLPSQHGIHDHISAEYDDRGWLADLTTLPELFAEAGYETAISGKWHCGRPDQERAFEHTFGVRDDSGYHDWYTTHDGDRRVTDHALSILRQRDAERPLFHFVGYTGTHSPFSDGAERYAQRHRERGVAPPEDVTYSRGRLTGVGTRTDCNEDPREATAQYLASVEGIDDGVGTLLDELDRHGMASNTVVVYTADHGLNLGHHGVWGKGNGTSPPNALEESIRVPLIVGGGADAIRSGQVRSEFVDHCDTHRTLLELAGIDPPSAPTRVGRSYAPLLTNADTPAWPDIHVGEYGPLRWARSGDHKLVRRVGGPDELIDLDRDPREERNRLDDPEYAAVVERLDEAIADRFDGLEVPFDGTDPSALPTYNAEAAWSDLG
jgi:arylsulfatase A-like enzyme